MNVLTCLLDWVSTVTSADVVVFEISETCRMAAVWSGETEIVTY